MPIVAVGHRPAKLKMSRDTVGDRPADADLLSITSEKFHYCSTGCNRCVPFFWCKVAKLNVAETVDTRGKCVLL